MRLREIMSKNVEAVSADATLAEAANIMARLDIGFLPVLDGDQIVGTVTDRDMVVRAVAKTLDSGSTRVREVMTEGVETVLPDDDVTKAAELMEKKQIRRLVLRDEKGAYLGVVSLGDLAQRAKDRELSGEALEKVTEPVSGD